MNATFDKIHTLIGLVAERTENPEVIRHLNAACASLGRAEGWMRGDQQSLQRGPKLDGGFARLFPTHQRGASGRAALRPSRPVQRGSSRQPKQTGKGPSTR